MCKDVADDHRRLLLLLRLMRIIPPPLVNFTEAALLQQRGTAEEGEEVTNRSSSERPTFFVLATTCSGWASWTDASALWRRWILFSSVAHRRLQHTLPTGRALGGDRRSAGVVLESPSVTDSQLTQSPPPQRALHHHPPNDHPANLSSFRLHYQQLLPV